MKLKDIESKTFYEILGVSNQSTKSEIKMAYREIARIYHPDSNFYSDLISSNLNDESVEIFKRITAAYHTLVDPKRRSEYDKNFPKGLNDWESQSSTENIDSTNLGSSYKGKSVGDSESNLKSSAYGVFGQGVETSSKEELNQKLFDSRQRSATFHKTPGIIDKLRKMMKN